MTYDRFKEIWTTLVTNRAREAGASEKCVFTNGVSERTVDALVAVANGDNSHFDRIQDRLPKRAA